MPYMIETCMAGETYEVRKYFTYKHHGTGTKRGAREQESPERIKRANLRAAETKLRRLMNHNFKDGDYLVRLDFSKDSSPGGSADMQKEMAYFIRRLKRCYQKVCAELKYIYVKEIGPKGGRHIHMMLNKCDIDWIRKSWKVGGIHIDPLYSHGQYGQIASYFIKYASRTEETEGKIIGKRYYASRSCKMPEVVKRVIAAGTFRKKVTEKKGFYLEKDSVVEGVNELTGYEYFCYTLHRIKEGG